MNPEDYSAIVASIKSYRGLSKDCAKMLASKYPSYPPVTLNAILSLQVQNKMKSSYFKVLGNNTNLYTDYIKKVKQQESFQNKTAILLKTAIELDTSPTLLAREVLIQYFKSQNKDCGKQHVNKILNDTTLIEDRNLAYDVYMCTLYDDQYGPLANASNESVGLEYEIKLENYLKEYKIPFRNENYLRTKGCDKTPDIKLEIPIAVDGFVVNWIESKALFGSVSNHKNYIKSQFLSYWNRFGPGLVIYWFGYVNNIIDSNESRFIVMDHFPENIICMDPSVLKE